MERGIKKTLNTKVPETESQNRLQILEEAKIAIEKTDAVRLKELSDKTIHTASTHQDSISITLAVIIYSLGKIMERTRYKEYPDWKIFYKIVISSIDNSISAIKEENEDKLKRNLELIRKSINKLSGNLKKYVQEVFRKASISKASRIYEHGISMEKTAKLLGITMYELAEYAGQTGISEVQESKTVDVKSRIKILEDMFA